VNLSPPAKVLNLLSAGVFVFCLLTAPDLRAAFVYESGTEFFSAGDFNGDGIADVLVLDKATGNARVGYSDGNGGLTWSAPLVSGVENATGLGVEHFLQQTNDAIAVTSPGFNQLNLVDLSHANAAGPPQTFAPMGIGPHSVVGLRAPHGSISPGLPFLLVASSFNDASAELLDLLQWSGAPLYYGLFNETGSFDRPNALDINSNTPTLAVGLVRGAINDALHIWEFDNIPGAVGTFSNLPSGSAYVFGNFNGEALPRFVFYQPGGSNLAIVPLVQTNSGFAFGPVLSVALTQAVQQVFFLQIGADGSALIQFGDGVQGLRLPGNSPVISAKYRTGAGAAGNVFTGIVPFTNGQFALLDAPPGSAASAHAQVISFDGTNFTQRSSSNLPLVNTRNTTANVWLFQLEPFVNRSPGFIASLSSPDWTDGISGLPGGVQAPTESDAGAPNGLGSLATNSLGAPPAGSAFGIANQYNPAISLFTWSASRSADSILVTISPPAGSYGSPLAISFGAAPSGSGVQYRVGGADSWHSYAGSFSISNDAVVRFYGTNALGARSSLQLASYSLGAPASGPPASPVIIDPGNTNTPPMVSTNQLILSQDGTVFYGRRSASSFGTIWAIDLDGSGDTYITTGARPRVSRDGRWLAFLREGLPFSSQGNVWVRDLQTGLERRLFANSDYVVSYGWETSDAALLMDYQCGIWDLNTNGTLSGVISADCFDDAPARSPADGRIAFHNLNPSGSVAGLYVAASDGSARQRIVSNVAGASWPGWSPDGQTLVFADSNNTNVDSGKNLWVVDPDGSNLIQISGFADLASGFPHGALWSPDSAALVSAGTVFGTNGLWIIPLTPERDGCDGSPYRLPTSPGDLIDFAGSIVVAPSTQPTFAVLPGLFIRLAPTAVVVYWTTGYAGFTLEYKTAVSPEAPWTPINGPYYLAGNYYEYWEATGSLQAAKFFRLRYTGAVVLSQPPALTGQVQAGAASISWPTNVAGFVLQSTTNLSPPVVWQDVAPPYDLSGLSFVYQDAPVGSAPRKFFRLRGP
jgi:hypothetical protein